MREQRLRKPYDQSEKRRPQVQMPVTVWHIPKLQTAKNGLTLTWSVIQAPKYIQTKARRT